jgi:hypothetical protein
MALWPFKNTIQNDDLIFYIFFFFVHKVTKKVKFFFLLSVFSVTRVTIEKYFFLRFRYNINCP